MNHLIRSGTMKNLSRLNPSHARNHFRIDLYEEARRMVEKTGPAIAATEPMLAPD